MRQGLRRRGLILGSAIALVCAVVGISVALAAPQPVPGAIFTTDSGCTGVDLNIYSNKGDVYLDGGPAHPKAAGLADGSYYVQVTDPSGATVLGKSSTADVTVKEGEFEHCYQLADIVNSASSGFTAKGYDDTPNEGGEYKVWVSTDPTFTNSLTKTDNFKVKTKATANRIAARRRRARSMSSSSTTPTPTASTTTDRKSKAGSSTSTTGSTGTAKPRSAWSSTPTNTPSPRRRRSRKTGSTRPKTRSK